MNILCNPHWSSFSYFRRVNQPQLSRITLYPIKSLDGIQVSAAEIGPGGSLRNDRRYALFNLAGNLINGKSTPKIHELRTSFDPAIEVVTVAVNGGHKSSFHLQDNRTHLEEYLSEFFLQPVFLKEDGNGQLQDDPRKNQFTMISAESLQAVAEQFDDMDLDECRRRFRINLEIEHVPAFWEDDFISSDFSHRTIRIGAVTASISKPVPRCVVPSRHPLTGEVWTGFQKQFSDFRKSTLPLNSSLEKYGHFYFLSVGCVTDELSIGKLMHCKDLVMKSSSNART